MMRLALALCVACVLSVVAFGAPPRPRLIVGGLPAPPTIDGRVGAGEWAQAAAVSGFAELGTGTLAQSTTTAYLAHDARALYIAFVCHATAPPQGARRPRDGAVWDDDAVEVFLDPGATGSRYVQLIGNCVGSRWDSRGRDGAWNAKWDFAAAVGKNAWTAEFRIPFASLGVATPTDGATWGINLARDRRTPTPEVSSWAYTGDSFHEPARFGRVVFRAGGPVLRLRDLARPGTNQVSGVLEARAAARPADLGVWLRAPNGTETRLQVLKAHAGKAAKASLAHKLPSPGRWSLRVALTEAGAAAPAAECHMVIDVPLPVAVELKKFFLTGRLDVAVDIKGLGAKLPGPRARIQVRDGKGTHVLSAPSARFEKGPRTTASFDVRNVPPGHYEAAVSVLDASGRQIGAAVQAFDLPARPPWLGSTAGISDKVMWPWTPVKALAMYAECWGRVYRFGATPFPTEVVTAGKDVLAGPVELRAVVGGKAVRWVGDHGHWVERSPALAVRRSAASGGGLRLEGTSLLEYDGMLRMDFDVVPDGAVEVDSLSFVVPLAAEHATLYHFWPGRWGSGYNSGGVPAKGMDLPFKPFVWLGDEERGLGWFSESDQGWSPKEASRAITVRREGNATVLRCDLIGKSIRLTRPLHYTFGLHATPVKPIPRDWHEQRIAHGAFYGMQTRPYIVGGRLTYPAKGHIRLGRGTLEMWLSPRFDPNIKITNPAARGGLNRECFAVRFPNGNIASLYWNIDDRGMRYYYLSGGKHPIVLGSPAAWKQGEWHHVALTWGDAVRIYADGKLVAERRFKGLTNGAPEDLAQAEIVFGGGPCEFAVDDIRISGNVRSAFDLGRPAPTDAHTLLIDPLDAKAVAGGHGTEGCLAVEGRFGRALAIGTQQPNVSTLDRAKQLGVRTLVYHENWTDIQNYTSTTHDRELRELVAACHARGIKLLLYFGYEISNIAPEWTLYARECLIRRPEAPLPTKGGYHRQPEQRAHIVCYNSPWQDFMADGIARMVREYGIDGVYLDGTIEPWGCHNHAHGCTCRRPDGSRGATYPIFAVRSLMKRLYAICDPEHGGHVNAHQSTCMVSPTLAFTTSYWDGEQFGSKQHVANPLEVLALDCFRAEFMGHQWGVPAEFLNYHPRPYTMDEALAFTLLHDVFVRPGGVGWMLEKMSPIWNAYTDFRYWEAEWLPYWRNADVATPSPEGVKVSLHSHKGHSVLLVVSNLTLKDVDAQVRLDLGRLGLAGGPLAARDVLLDQPVALEHGVLRLPIPRFSMRLIRIDRTGS